jgi:hypothetical protein
MGAGNSAKYLRDTTISPQCIEFCVAFENIGGNLKDTGATAARKMAWKGLDNNGNGHVSLAETGKWIQDTLTDTYGTDRGTELYKAFYPSYIRAFKDAADWGADNPIKGTKSATGDDYIQYKEFRLLAVYLCLFAVMFDAFSSVDGADNKLGAGDTAGDDRRLSLAEWENALKSGLFRGHPAIGLKAAQTNAKLGKKFFQQMDADGHGMVLLNEWCEWIEDMEVEHETYWGKMLNAGEDPKTIASQLEARKTRKTARKAAKTE